ncbi:MAG: EAL domain-containing protein [Helicobacteraceae bacterium]|nr:EAL domain-containing protein [Helicobacteraceae bacterium]
MEKARSWNEKEKTMTLFKQMALMVSLIIIIMLGSVMAINYQSAKKDMLESLNQTTINNLQTLMQKIIEANNFTEESSDDEEIIEESSNNALIESEIDGSVGGGYYRMVKFSSESGSFEYMQIDNDPVEGVPLWFIEFSSIKLQTVSEDIMDGFNMLGVLSVEGDPGIVYKALYKMFTNLLYIFAISVALALLVLSSVLHFVLKPLYRVQHQAESILKNEFIIQEQIPYTTEFKDVVYGMNAMVNKVEDIFEKGNEAAQRNRELLYNDPTTKLFNRRYLMLKLPDLIKEANKTEGGVVIFIALSGAEAINQVLGRQKADDMFLSLASSFNNVCKEYEERLIARVNGTEFTLMLPDCEAKMGYEVAQKININFEALLQSNELDNKKIFIDIGIYRYKPSVNVGELLTRADNALSQAKAKEGNNIHLYEEQNDENAMGKEQWRTIIEESIHTNLFSLKFWPTMNAKSKTVEHSVMTFTIDGGENKKYFYGDFIAPAINLGLVSKIYIVTLKDLITQRHAELDGSICSIRLSNEFIKDPKAFDELSVLLNEYAKTIQFDLSFEVTDSFAINNTATVKSFVELFNKYNFGFGLNAFTGESNNFTYLKELNPKFLKADCAFLLDQSQDSMSALQVITDSLGIDIIATFVKTEDELKKLQTMHIDSVQGPITDSIKVS